LTKGKGGLLAAFGMHADSAIRLSRFCGSVGDKGRNNGNDFRCSIADTTGYMPLRFGMFSS
jgi:hypothetical protein